MLLLVIAVFFGIAFSQQNSSVNRGIKNAIVQVVVDDFHLIVVGAESTPRYTFWLGSNDTIVYSIYIKQFFEIIGYFDTKIAASAITPMKWIFSDTTRRSDGWYFTLSHSPDNSTHDPPRYTSIVIDHRIAFRNAANSSCPGEICVQYTFHLNGYQWLSHDAKASLAVSYWITSSAQNEPDIVTYDTSIVYGSAILEVEKTAKVDEPNGLTTWSIADVLDPEDHSENWVKYQRFDGNLEHKGMIGFTTDTIIEFGGYFLMSFNDILLYAGIAAVVVFCIVVGMWAYNRYQNRKSEYIEID